MCAPPDQKDESPDEVELVEASGIEALPSRIERYGRAKQRALDVAEHIATKGERHARLFQRVQSCGNTLLFRQYAEVDEVRLHKAFLCAKALLCPLCAIRRGSKALSAYLPRYDTVRGEQPSLRPFLVTLTVKDGPDLRERYEHLKRSQHELWKRRQRRRGCSLDEVEAAVWSYEVKRGAGSGLWHPHLHMLVLAEHLECEEADSLGRLSREWKDITGDSHMVNVRPITGDPLMGFLEVFKYALKFSDMDLEDTWQAFKVLSGQRLVGSAGRFRGIEIPEQLTDEPLDDLAYTELLYEYIVGSGYSLWRRH